VTGGWRELHKEGLHGLYSLPSVINVMESRRMRWVEHEAHTGQMRNAYRTLVEKYEGKRPLSRPRCRC
jgi:hypothetical protein